VCSFVAFVDVFALSIFVFVSLGADAIAIFLNKAGLAVTVKVAVSVFAVLWRRVTRVSVVCAFIDVDTLAGLFLVAVGADTIAVFLDKPGFAVAVEAAVGVFACFGGGVAGVSSFAAFIDVDTFTVLLLVAFGADATAVFLNKTGLAVAI
jgi:hypothetical protein